MTTPGGITADQTTIRNMVVAFEKCEDECATIHSRVEGMASNLASAWQSDDAAPKYQNTIAEWLDGFHQVQAGLDMLNGQMQQYSQLTDTTEQQGGGYAGGWAR